MGVVIMNPSFAFGSSNKGQQKQANSLHFYDAIICRSFAKERFKPDEMPRIEVLLQKSSRRKEFGFVSHLCDKSLSKGAMKHNLYNTFVKSCGSKQPGASQFIAPPLIGTDTPEGCSTSYIFILPRTHNNWFPQPGEQKKHIEYSNEQIQINGKPYTVQFGHVWVNVTDLYAECAKEGQVIIQDNTRATMKKAAQSIWKTGTEKNRMMYHRTFTSASTDDVLLSQDVLFQIKCSVSYVQPWKFTLSFVNMSKYPVQFAMESASLKSPNLLSVTKSELALNDFKAIEPQKTFGKSTKKSQSQPHVDCFMEFQVGGFFNYADLPVLDVIYGTKEAVHKSRVRVPIFLYRFCTPVPENLKSNDPTGVKSFFEGKWNQLPNSNDFTVSLRPEDNAQKFITQLNNLKLPMCTPFDNIFPIAAVLGESINLHLLRFNGLELTVSSKYSEPALFQSVIEIIYGVASSSAGLEQSFLDTEPFPQ